MAKKAKNWLTPTQVFVYVAGAVALYTLFFFVFFGQTWPFDFNQQDDSVNFTVALPGWRVPLKVQNDSKISGTAVLSKIGAKTKLVLTVSGMAATVAMPAHIHFGNCPTPGAVKYPLSTVVNGRSETVLDVSVADLKKMAPLAVNVHQSAAQMGVYVACGNLK